MIGQRLSANVLTDRIAKAAMALGVLALLTGFITTVLATPILPGQGTAIGGFAVLAGAALAYLSARQTRLSHERASTDTITEQKEAREQEHRREVERDLRARFTDAATQLGSDSFASRVAGVYAVAALADDWSNFGRIAERQVCIDLLCAYLRTPPREDQEPGAALQEQEVRSTILTVIARKVRMDPVDGDGPWQDCRFDLRGARLRGVVFERARFRGQLQFTDCVFDGEASFAHSHLVRADFAGATFKDTANFSSTQLWNVDLSDVSFECSALFKRTQVQQDLDLTSVTVGGRLLNFTGARFNPQSNTWMRGLDFTYQHGATVMFTNAWFRGNVHFEPVEKRLKQVSFNTPQSWRVPPKVPWSDTGIPPAYVRPAVWPPPRSATDSTL